MKIYIIIITCLIIMITGQVLDYSDKEKDWNCSGTEQSPIDFPLDLSNYFDGSKKLRLLTTSYPIINGKKFEIHNQHTYGLTLEEPIGTLDAIFNNEIIVRYNLISFDFHIGAEHTFGNRRYEMEINFVHEKNTQWLTDNGINDPDPDHTHLVVGLLVTVNSEVSDNPYLDSWNIRDFSPVSNLDINPLVSAYQDYFHYEGSMTTPACNEIVNWIVMRNPLIISSNQFNHFSKWIKELYPLGRIYRKVQDLNGRNIFYVHRSGRKNLN